MRIAALRIRWTVNDHFGNASYLTQERWDHIVGPNNHPEMVDFEEHLKKTIRTGIRKQDPLNPQKYRYVKAFEDLPEATIRTLLPLYCSGSGKARGVNLSQTTTSLQHIRKK